MKIAVISSYAYIVSNVNYGALLQYYALQEYLKERGHHPYWIRYVIRLSLKQSLKKIVKSVIYCRAEHKKKMQLQSFLDFAARYLALSDKTYVGEAAINSDPPAADYYITGSDQVWAGTLPANFLTFVGDDTRKIAYAVSFGRDELQEEHANTIRPWIGKFDKISVREKSGIDICYNLCRKSAVHVPDPTLLIDKEKYPAADFGLADYIFCYFINLNIGNSVRLDDLISYAQSVNKEFFISAATGSEKHIPSDYLVYPSPEEWLGYYKHAGAIVTNTFHGTLFSIIFERPFLCILQNGDSSRQNCRILSLLSSLGLQDRILDPSDSIAAKMHTSIDWAEVKRKIADLRLNTDAFLGSFDL